MFESNSGDLPVIPRFITHVEREREPLSGRTSSVLAVGITERTSTCRLSPAAALVSRGLKFIQLNAKRNITVSAIVAHLGVSRRLADLRFRQIENKSILQIITAQCLEAIKQQLLKSNASIATITRSCGFSSPGYLKELFRSHV